MLNYKKKSIAAVTLVEILVVIGVMAATIGMSAVFIKYQQPNIQLYAASHSLRSRLQKARQITLTEQIQHGIQFDTQDKSYLLIDTSGPTIVETFTLPPNIDFGAITQFTNNQVNFNSAGVASQAGYITIENSRGDQKTITINPSGYLEIE